MKVLKKPKGLRAPKTPTINVPDTFTKMPPEMTADVIEKMHQAIDEIEVGLSLAVSFGSGPVKESVLETDTGFRILSLMYYTPSMDKRVTKTEVKEHAKEGSTGSNSKEEQTEGKL
jgi:hypothetical protein